MCLALCPTGGRLHRGVRGRFQAGLRPHTMLAEPLYVCRRRCKTEQEDDTLQTGVLLSRVASFAAAVASSYYGQLLVI